MYPLGRHLVVAAVALAVATLQSQARAWVETAIQSDVVTLDVVRDGRTTVRHELTMQVRGGPLKKITLQGVDEDAVPLPAAVVTDTTADRRQPRTLPLLLHRGDDASLRLEIDDTRGLRRGTYLFQFGYETASIHRSLCSLDEGKLGLSWVGPRYDSGIDLAKVVFRLARGRTAPELWLDGAEGGTLAETDPLGTVVANTRRGAQRDELELVRPHVARGEPVVWAAQVSRDAVQGAPQATDMSPAATAPATDSLRSVQNRWLWLVAPLVALAYAVLVLAKAASVRRLCRIRNARPRAIVKWPPLPRAVLAGIFLASAIGVVTLTGSLVVSLLPLTAALALAVHAAPRSVAVPRGPGRWLPLSPEEAFQRTEQPHPGAWLDAGCARGRVVLAGAIAAVTVVSCVLWVEYPQGASAGALVAASLVAVFFGGGARQLPADAARGPQRLLAWMYGRLRRDRALRVVPWARIPHQAEAPDELRLLVHPRNPCSGLLAIEVAFEYPTGLGGPVALPCIIVRAQEGSASHAALPLSCVWMRGRTHRERVAILRPGLPLRSVLLSLIRQVIARLSDQREPCSAQREWVSSASSSGSRASTVKAGMVMSPGQAT